MTQKIMFVCVGNSCRSQMAEGFARAFAPANVEVFSAGTHPSGYIHPKAIRVMQEKGIDISEQYSKVIDPQLLAQMNLVVTVCEESQACPLVPPQVPHQHIPIHDPVGPYATEEEQLQAFRRVRDTIE